MIHLESSGNGKYRSHKIFVECDCESHAIELMKFHDEDSVWLTFWFMGFKNLSLLERLRVIWNILIRGRSCAFEQMVLLRENAVRLKECLEELLADGPVEGEC